MKQSSCPEDPKITNLRKHILKSIVKPRHGNKYIEVVTRSGYIENYRIQKVYKPEVLKIMCSSPYLWWGATDYWREKLTEYLAARNQEEAAGQKSLPEGGSGCA